jgi:hypothetical protein
MVVVGQDLQRKWNLVLMGFVVLMCWDVRLLWVQQGSSL